MSTRVFILVFFACALLGLPPGARAGGLLVAPDQLSPAVMAGLRAEIVTARREDPEVFARVARLRADLPELDRAKHGRLVPVPAILAPLGGRALWPILERLAVDSLGRDGLGEAAWRAWRGGLVEAVGRLRDERAEPVLRAILDGPERDPLVMRLAVEAVAKLGSEAVGLELVARSEQAGPWREALLAGMGLCRRFVVAERLVQVLDSQPPEPLAVVVAKALGDIGSASGWRLLAAPEREEGAEVRALAAGALVRAYLRYDGATRRMVTRAVAVVGHDQTLALIATARAGASPAGVAALALLAERFEQSSLRPRR